MTRSEFMARMVIAHLSVDRAAKYAKALEENEEFEGWDEDEPIESEAAEAAIDTLVLRVQTLLEQVDHPMNTRAVLDLPEPFAKAIAAVRDAYEPFEDDGGEDEVTGS